MNEAKDNDLGVPDETSVGLSSATPSAPVLTDAATPPLPIPHAEGTHAYASGHGPSKRGTMRQYVKEQHKQPTQATVNCPVCNGTGQLPHPKLGLRSNEGAGVALSIMAKALREQKYSLREIGKFLGYDSPRSIQMLLKKHGMK